MGMDRHASRGVRRSLWLLTVAAVLALACGGEETPEDGGTSSRGEESRSGSGSDPSVGSGSDATAPSSDARPSTGVDPGRSTGGSSVPSAAPGTTSSGSEPAPFRPPGCGDGVISGDETCDPPETCPRSCVTERPCTDVVLVGNPEWCTAECIEIPIVTCADGDGCCPAHCTEEEDDDCPGLCGDGVVDEGETCDPPESCPDTCDDGLACTAGRLLGAAETCTAVCEHHVIAACVDGDGCCPPGCTPENDDDCAAVCGNGVREPGERCDGDCPDTCETFEACHVGRLVGGPDTCDARCEVEVVTACVDDDGCCPAHCDASNDNDCPDTCEGGGEGLSLAVRSVPLSGDFGGIWADLPAFGDEDDRPQDAEILLRSRSTGDVVPIGRVGDTVFATRVAAGRYDVVMRRPGTSETFVLQPDVDASSQGAGLSLGELREDSNQVRVVFRINGETPSMSLYDYGTVLLRRVPAGAWMQAGNTRDGSSNVIAPAGHYDIQYRGKASQGGAPANPIATLAAAVPVNPAVSLVVDIPAIDLHGDFTIGGQAPPFSIYDNGEILLRLSGTTQAFPIGQTRNQAYSVRVIPGQYDVLYRSLADMEHVPRTPGVLLRSGVTLGESGRFDIDVPVVRPQLTVLLNGQTPTLSIYDRAELWLRPTQMEGEEVRIHDTRFPGASPSLVPGRYDVLYRLVSHHSSLPINTEALLLEDIEVGHADIDIDIVTARLQGTATLNGAAFSPSIYSRATFDLVDSVTGARTTFGRSNVGAWNVPVLPGTYDIHYSAEEGVFSVPINRDARLRDGVEIAGDTTLNLDVRASRWDGNMTLDGGPFPSSIYQIAEMRLRDLSTEHLQTMTRTNQGSFSVLLLHGTYEVLYHHVQGELIPPNRGARVVDPFALEADRTADIAVVTQALGGSFLVDELPLSGGNNALYQAVDRNTGDRFSLGEGASRSFSVRVIPGSYELRYTWVAGEDIPRNENVRLGCVDVIRPQ